MDPSLNGYDLERRFALLDRLQDDIAAEPGVRSVCMAEVALMTNSTSSSPGSKSLTLVTRDPSIRSYPGISLLPP